MFIALVISVLILPVALSANNDSLAVAIQEYFEHKAGDYFLNGYTSIDHYYDVTVFDIDVGDRQDYFGHSVFIDGKYVIVGAKGNDDRG